MDKVVSELETEGDVIKGMTSVSRIHEYQDSAR